MDFSCSILSGNSSGTVLKIAEKIADNIVRYNSPSLRLKNVKIPKDKKILIRVFICELWSSSNELVVSSDSAELVVVTAGKIMICPVALFQFLFDY